MKKNLILVLTISSLHLVSVAQGIPTIDVANLAQSINQVLAWKQQYEQMIQQLDQMRQANATALNSYQAMSGNRGLGLISNAIQQSVVPTGFLKQLSGTTNHQDASTLVNAQLQRINASTGDRFAQIQQLMSAINTTNDTKAIGELNARIAAEQAMIQNEAKEAAVLQQQYAQQIAAIEQSRIQRSIRANSQIPRAAP
jgi:type IV secretion system protein VirB5